MFLAPHGVNPVVRLVGSGADEHIDACIEAVEAAIGILNNEGTVTLGETIKLAHFIVEGNNFFSRERLQVGYGLGSCGVEDALGQVLAVQGAAGERHTAALHDGTLEEALSLVDARQQGDAARASRVAKNGHIIGVATEGCDISFYPAQRLELIEDAQVATAGKSLPVGQRREVEEAEQSQAIANRDEDDLGMRLDKAVTPVARVARSIADIRTAMNPDHDRTSSAAHTAGGSPYIEVQAVLALGIERSGIAL